MANHIAHFEVFATDVERARAFYEQVFSWRFQVGGPPDFYFIVTGPPVEHAVTRGLIAKRTMGPPAAGNINALRCTISVESIKETAAKIESAGGTLRSDADPQVLGMENLEREAILFLCRATLASQRGARHAHALALLEESLRDARPETFTLPRPQSERARLLADYFAQNVHDGRSVQVIVEQIGGASLRTFERMFSEETGLSLAAWRRHCRLLMSVSMLEEGMSIGEVARAVGYESAAAFSTAFRQCFGLAPSRCCAVSDQAASKD